MRLLLIFTLAVWAPNHSQAQLDFGGWYGLDFGLAKFGKVNLGLETQTRFDTNHSHVENAFFSPYVNWKVSKHIRLDGAYRMSWLYNEPMENSTNSHRYTLDLRFTKLVSLISSSSRSKFDLRLRGTSEYTDENGYDHYLRLKANYNYNLPKTKVEPYFATEIFYHFRDQVIYTFHDVQVVNRFDKIRIKAGVSKPLNKVSLIKVGLMYQQQLGNNKSDLVLQIKYNYDFGKKIRKKEK